MAREESLAPEQPVVVKEKKPLKTKFEVKVGEKAKMLDGLIGSIDENNQVFLDEIDDTVEDVGKLREQVGDEVPGKKLKKYMKNWQKSIGKVHTTHDVKTWASEYWMTLEQFEQHLVDEEMKIRANQGDAIWKLQRDD